MLAEDGKTGEKFLPPSPKRARVNLAILAVRKIQKMTNLQFIVKKVLQPSIFKTPFNYYKKIVRFRLFRAIEKTKQAMDETQIEQIAKLQKRVRGHPETKRSHRKIHRRAKPLTPELDKKSNKVLTYKIGGFVFAVQKKKEPKPMLLVKTD